MLIAVAVAAGSIAALAVLPSPSLTVTRTPEVVPQHTPPGNVRNIALASDGPYVQAAIEVFDGTDYEIYYWTDVPGLTPSATAVTGDIVEQRWARIVARGDQMTLAWIEDVGGGSIIRTASKDPRGYKYSWSKPSTLLAKDHPLGGLAVALAPNGKAVVAFVEQRRVWVTWPPGSTTLERVTTAAGKDPAERNPSIAIGDDGRVAVAFEREAGIALSERTPAGWGAPRFWRGGRRPQLAPDGEGWRIGYTEGGGSGARLAVRSTSDGGIKRYGIGLGTGAPVALTFLGIEPVVGYVRLAEKAALAWIAREGRPPLQLPVPVERRRPSPAPR